MGATQSTYRTRDLTQAIVGIRRAGSGLAASFGSIRPQVALDATNEYFEEQDFIRHWIEERCDTGKTLWDSSSNLFKSWTTWAHTNGEKPGSSNRFRRAHKQLGFKPHSTNKARGFRGIEAKPDIVQQHWSERAEQ
jgi:putative DNA primase/helicase